MAIALAVALHGSRGTHVDSRALIRLRALVTGPWVRVTLDMSTPAVSLVLLAAVLVIALLTRRYALAVLAVGGPALATGLTEYIVKPVVGRHYGSGDHVAMGTSLAYPSGHETFVASAALVLLFATCALSSRTRVRALVALVLMVWTVVAGVGLVVNFWHYTTDVIGAVALSLAVVLAAALLIDRLSSPGGRGRTRTARAA